MGLDTTVLIGTSDFLQLTLDGISYLKLFSTGTTNAQADKVQTAPVWLPAGTYTLSMSIGNLSGSNPTTQSNVFKFGISALDFEMVP